jgi:hypothetical protein
MAWKLGNIKTKVRLLTGRPNQLSDSDLTDYINNYYQQDLIALLNLREEDEWLHFATLLNVEEYGNIPENYALRGPAYVNGAAIRVVKDAATFYEEQPLNYQTRESVGTGDAATTNFTGTLNQTTIDRENIVFDDDVERITVRPYPVVSAITAAANAAVTTSANHNLATGDTVMIRDISSGMTEMNNKITPITVTSTTAFTCDDIDSTNFTVYEGGGLVIPLSKVYLVGDRGGSGSVIPSTGVYDITFNDAPADGQDIRANYEVISTGVPTIALLSDRSYRLRPVPDGTYDVRIGVSKQPASLSVDGDVLDNDDWGKLVA